MPLVPWWHHSQVVTFIAHWVLPSDHGTPKQVDGPCRAPGVLIPQNEQRQQAALRTLSHRKSWQQHGSRPYLTSSQYNQGSGGRLA